MSNPYPAAIGLSLLIAVYMFAAMRFPALRFIFRLKRGVARLSGTSDEQNRKVGETLGLILCPIIGLGALGFAIHSALEWRDVNARERARVQMIAREAQAAGELLADGKVGTVNIGEPALERIASDPGKAQIESFLHSLAPAVTPETLVRRGEPNRRDQLLIEFKPQKDKSPAVWLKAVPTQGYVHLQSGSDAWAIKVPDALRESFASLAQVEQIDLLALRRQEEQKKADEDRRRSNYVEVAHQGPAAWQILEAVAAEPLENRSTKCAEYAGVPIDWELELASIKEEGDQVRVTAVQSHPPGPKGNTPVRTPGVQFVIPKQQAADLKYVPSKTWVRATGKVESVPLHKLDFTKQVGVTIHLQVDKFTAFQPDITQAPQ